MESNIKRSAKNPMSESWLVMAIITMSGGLQDAYTYVARDKVFANVQTGNIVLMMGRILQGDLSGILKYLFPLIMFSLGVLMADQIRVRCVNQKIINWWQVVVLVEAALLFVTAFIPAGQPYNLLANSIVSFSCAMQLESFRKVKGLAYASTMCVGNMRSAMVSLSKWMWTGDSRKRREFFEYCFVILCFAIGAGVGIALNDYIAQYTILISSGLLVAAAVALRF